MKPVIITTTISLIAFPALAEDQLVPLDVIPERPYPYAILDTRPGDDVETVMQLFTERTEAEPYGDTEVIRVTSPEGHAFEFTHDVWHNIGGRNRQEILGQSNRNYPEAFRIELATETLAGTPLVISRSMRQPTGDLPEAPAFRAQIEETYGPPSKVETDNRFGTMTLTYAWGEDGFIPDLDAQPEREITWTERGRERTGTYRPCHDSDGGTTGETEYRFQYPRRNEIMPGCVAIFRVGHSAKPGQTSISFRLTDYELARLNRNETDRQIVDALTGEQEVEASDMDL